MTNIYLKVTKSGHVYDQSFGKNKKLYVNRKYILKGGGSIEVRNDGSIELIRRDSKNNVIYSQHLKEDRIYVSNELGCEILLNRSRYVSTAYRYCKEHVGIDNEINISEKLDRPFQIELTVEQGVLDYRLSITVSEKLFDHTSFNRLAVQIDRINRIDFKKFIRHYNALETTFTIDENFFKIIGSLGMYKGIVKMA